METIIIILDSARMQNPDLDIRYQLPERLEEYTNNKIRENGYDYISEKQIGLWMETDNAEEAVALVIELIKAETFLENDLSESAEIYISQQENAEISDSKKVFPV